MNEKRLLFAFILLFGVFISSLSQVFLKKSSEKQYESQIKEYLNPLVISAYAIFFIATFLTIIAYKEIPISMGPVLEATSYIYVTIFGVTIFKEKMNVKKVVALLLIIVGICVFSFWG